MSKRNLTILITALTIIIVAFGFWYFNKSEPSGEGEGTNFGFDFNPFNNKKSPSPGDTTTPPTDVSGYVPPPDIATQAIKLRKVSSMPIAGFGIFMKERYKEIPNPAIGMLETFLNFIACV